MLKERRDSEDRSKKGKNRKGNDQRRGERYKEK
jgi:hypothetical protein